MQILVVDDDPDVLELVEVLLAEAGHTAVACADGDSALVQLECAGIDPALALLDVLMPVMDGIELARRLRQLRPQLPILFMTGHSRGRLPDLGDPPAGLLRKPFRPQQLIDEIDRLASPGLGRIFHGRS